jgi:class 3 adenylate cyclase
VRASPLHAFGRHHFRLRSTSRPALVASREIQSPPRGARSRSCSATWWTTLSGNLDPEEHREILSAFQGCCSREIARFKGHVAQYMGDGVLVYFGYPAAHEDDAERAVRTGLAIIAAVPLLRTLPSITLQVRVGIASGLAVVGDLTGDAQEQAAVGETTNLAARLQALAEPNTVLIAPETFRLVAGLFDCRDLGPQTLKGFARPVDVRRVLGPSRAASRFEARHEQGVAPLLGREEELDLLLRRWAQAKAGEGRVIHITGEPGIGKSRLTQALVDCLGGDRHTRVECHCSPYHTDSALHPVISHLLRAAGIEHTDQGEERLAKLEALLERSHSSLSETAPLLLDGLWIRGAYPSNMKHFASLLPACSKRPNKAAGYNGNQLSSPHNAPEVSRGESLQISSD